MASRKRKGAPPSASLVSTPEICGSEVTPGVVCQEPSANAVLVHETGTYQCPKCHTQVGQAFVIHDLSVVDIRGQVVPSLGTDICYVTGDSDDETETTEPDNPDVVTTDEDSADKGESFQDKLEVRSIRNGESDPISAHTPQPPSTAVAPQIDGHFFTHLAMQLSVPKSVTDTCERKWARLVQKLHASDKRVRDIYPLQTALFELCCLKSGIVVFPDDLTREAGVALPAIEQGYKRLTDHGICTVYDRRVVCVRYVDKVLADWQERWQNKQRDGDVSAVQMAQSLSVEQAAATALLQSASEWIAVYLKWSLETKTAKHDLSDVVVAGACLCAAAGEHRVYGVVITEHEVRRRLRLHSAALIVKCLEQLVRHCGLKPRRAASSDDDVERKHAKNPVVIPQAMTPVLQPTVRRRRRSKSLKAQAKGAGQVTSTTDKPRRRKTSKALFLYAL